MPHDTPTSNDHTEPVEVVAAPCGYVDPRVARTHDAVVAAAGALLLEHGPDAVTHARISEVTSYSRTTLYKHWPTRAHLIRVAMDNIGKHSIAVEPPVGDLRADLRTMLGHLVHDLRDEAQARLMITMLERARHDESVAEVREQMMCEIEPPFDAMIAAAKARGELRDDLEPRLARATLVGSMLFFTFLADDPVTDDLLDRIIDDFITTNAPRPA